MIARPAYGSPCNGCGECCRESICPLGSRLFGTSQGPCPALEPDHGGEPGAVVCGLVKRPRVYAPVRTAMHGAGAMSLAARRLIGAGMGCDFRDMLKDYDPAMRAKSQAAMDDAEANARAARLWITNP